MHVSKERYDTRWIFAYEKNYLYQWKWRVVNRERPQEPQQSSFSKFFTGTNGRASAAIPQVFLGEIYGRRSDLQRPKFFHSNTRPRSGSHHQSKVSNQLLTGRRREKPITRHFCFLLCAGPLCFCCVGLDLRECRSRLSHTPREQV